MTGWQWQILALVILALAVAGFLYATWWRPGSEGPDDDGTEPGELEPDGPPDPANDLHPAELADIRGEPLSPELLAELDEMERRELERMRRAMERTTSGES